MSNATAGPAIRLRGVRHNNLKNFDLDLPLNRLIVMTGLSGSGKSSLAFDTLYAEGQRRYIETFSPYARQFFDRMDKPRVDSIEGIPPAIAIEQRNTVRTTRSTVGTMTEVCDYMKVLWPHVAALHCRQCGQLVRKDAPREVWDALTGSDAPFQPGAQPPENQDGPALPEALVTFDLPLSRKLSLEESLELITKQGYQRLLVGTELCRIEEAAARLGGEPPAFLTVAQDRLRLAPRNRARFIEACEQAYHFGKGKLAVRVVEPRAGLAAAAVRRFSNRLHCAVCDLEYREPSAALFSFNHSVGACPVCRGFGRTITIDYRLAVPDWNRTLAEGVVKPWLTATGAECQKDLMRFCRLRGVPTHVPFHQLDAKWRDWVIDGDPGYGSDAQHEWPRAWYGVKGYFRWLESRSYKMHVRVLLSRYRSYRPCPACAGRRFQPDALLFRAPPAGPAQAPLTLADFYGLPLRDAAAYIEGLAAARRFRASEPLQAVLNEVRSRLGYLVEVGLGYLTLDRPTRSLSGGETQRVHLTTCVGTRLVNTLFVLDEPSVGLHPRDTDRLVRVLERLRRAGNTLVVVEHEARVMRAADQVVDLGPGHGETGGAVVYQGGLGGLLRHPASLTGQYLSGKRCAVVARGRPRRNSSRRQSVAPRLSLRQVTRHNLKDLEVDIPLERFVCVTGVSGSGKTTLVREVLLPAIETMLEAAPQSVAASRRLEVQEESSDNEEQLEGETPAPGASLSGWESLGHVVLVDQAVLGKTPRSNPALYVGAFDHLRDLFARSEMAQQRGLGPSAFSFNSAEGRCERCRGAGFEKIEMQFLSDIFIRCPDCGGRRYRDHVLEIKVSPTRREPSTDAKSIVNLLDSTVDEAIEFLRGFADQRPARLAARELAVLQEVGLGYLRLGQPINTLSGGECQRLKLVRQMAAAADRASVKRSPDSKPTLFLFDEPTTGLHFDDVRVLLEVFQRLVDEGHSVLVIEHNLDVIKSADWIIDLGPEGGDGGGRLVVAGTPAEVAACAASHTGAALRAG
jgi:excinuclease ABC subunit A